MYVNGSTIKDNTGKPIGWFSDNAAAYVAFIALENPAKAQPISEWKPQDVAEYRRMVKAADDAVSA